MTSPSREIFWQTKASSSILITRWLYGHSSLMSEGTVTLWMNNYGHINAMKLTRNFFQRTMITWINTNWGYYGKIIPALTTLRNWIWGKEHPSKIERLFSLKLITAMAKTIVKQKNKCKLWKKMTKTLFLFQLEGHTSQIITEMSYFLNMLISFTKTT